MRRPYDLVVIGAEPAGLAAVACAAKTGARTALLRAGAADAALRAPSSVAIPDFVWRRLELHASGLDVRPVAAYVSVFESGRTVRTRQGRAISHEPPEDLSEDGRALWTDFFEELRGFWRSGGGLARKAALNGARKPAPFLSALRARNGGALAMRLAAPAAALLDDYFSGDAADEELKTHLASVALFPFGAGGNEAGSGLALASLSAPAGWRVRTLPGSPSLQAALEEAARSAGVDLIDRRARQFQDTDEKLRTVMLTDGDRLRARAVMAASEAAAARAGLPVAHGLSPLARGDGAVAELRLRFDEPPPVPEDGEEAVYFLAGSVGDIAAAREAALQGRLPDNPPVAFEFANGDIYVRAPYCPSVLKADGETRDWTEQDRQALGRLVLDRLAPVLNGAAKSVRRIDVRLSQAGAPKRAPAAGAVLAPHAAHDPVGAAVRLALDLVSG